MTDYQKYFTSIHIPKALNNHGNSTLEMLENIYEDMISYNNSNDKNIAKILKDIKDNRDNINENTKNIKEILKDFCIKDGSLSLSKFDENIINDLKDIIVNIIHDRNEIVTFDIENGYLVAYVGKIKELNFVEEDGYLYLIK